MKKLFTYDRYPQGRPTSKKVEIKCINCATTQFIYQKDGSGTLEKLFLDLILDNPQVKNNQKLICPSCEKVLGTKFSHGSVNRLAFKLYPGSIYYKVVK
ncbi:hypothetical protein KBC75_01150 [Candidatus Shapirobacteria bacterium]|nr:hypothetical protein [Candidatus Shapirobacteria bacterium]